MTQIYRQVAKPAIRSVFVHEYVHYLDSLRHREKFARPSFQKSPTKYWTCPTEYNAYYHQGFQRFIDVYLETVPQFTPESLKAWMQRLKKSFSPEARETEIARLESQLIRAYQMTSWDQFRFTLEAYWNPRYIFQLRQHPKTWRKFLKRLWMGFETWRLPYLASRDLLENILEEEKYQIDG